MQNISKSRFLLSVSLILLITGIVSTNSDVSETVFLQIQSFLSDYLGWMIILLANGFLVFTIYLLFTKYKNIRLGGPNATPSYTYVNWIAMLFSAGLGIGLLFYGVAEPLMHMSSFPGMIEGDNSFNASKAINLANLHWGLHGWAVYSSLGLCFAYASYNKKLPFRVSSLLGEKVASNKPLAVAIDVIAILTTVFGVTTSLGLGTVQISAGMAHIFGIEETFTNKVYIIIFITLLGLTSVSLGLNAGIKKLSQVNMIIAIGLLLLVFIFGPTVFILNALVQNFGAYLNTILQSATWTEVYNTSSWQNGWTLFYYTWWFSWAPFVSLFIARISYGRTIKEFIVGVLFVPSLIVFIWMGVFGNAAIYQVINNTSDISQIVASNMPVALFTLYDVYPFAQPLSIISLVLIVTFFVTSSDSGALVASMLSSKDQSDIHDDSPMISRVTWAILLGVVAAVLLYAGGLTALQTSVVITGVPFAFIMVFACMNLLKDLKESGNTPPGHIDSN
jgi:choline/glycine/proline betaine transport protein|tara:strand:+ start:143 stop:1657 length:1515 start_codon:yes stop_codon:yes gene_type:complete